MVVGSDAFATDAVACRLMGIQAEQIAFPEIDYDRIDKLRGLNISITTSARTDEEGRALLAAFQFPFRG